MREFRKTLLAGSLLFLAGGTLPAAGEETATGIKALMTPEQYERAGLHKLSKEERDALYQWLRRYTGEDMPAAVVTVPPAVTESSTAAGTAAPSAAAETSPAAAVIPAASAATAPPAAPPAPATPVQPATTAAVTPAPAAGSVQAIEENFGLPESEQEKPEDKFKMYATVKQPFKGWNGKTVFYLDNGQVWRQRSAGRYTYMGDDSRVVISKNRFGFFEMRLIDADRSVGVKRVK